MITVLGCHDSDPGVVAGFADWEICRDQPGDSFPQRDALALRVLARDAGYLP